MIVLSNNNQENFFHNEFHLKQSSMASVCVCMSQEVSKYGFMHEKS